MNSKLSPCSDFHDSCTQLIIGTNRIINNQENFQIIYIKLFTLLNPNRKIFQAFKILNANLSFSTFNSFIPNEIKWFQKQVKLKKYKI